MSDYDWRAEERKDALKKLAVDGFVLMETGPVGLALKKYYEKVKRDGGESFGSQMTGAIRRVRGEE